MKIRNWLLVLVLLLAVNLCAQVSKMESEYQELAMRYEARDKNLVHDLKEYLKKYPYTTYEDEVHFMIGAIQTERMHYKQALKDLDVTDHKLLARPHQEECLFYRGYSNLMLQQYDKASVYFALLRKTGGKYQQKGAYYYAYCLYKQGLYDKALPVLLNLEGVAEYQKTVPYYLIQIYYFQNDYEEVIARAERVLAEQPESENNGEIHRILGEMYYQQGNYARAIEHLTIYSRSPREEGTELVRNDMYLLGMAQYRGEEYEQAIRSLKLVKPMRDTISESTFLTMGNAYRQVGNIEQAKMAYQTAASYQLTPSLREEALYNYVLTTYQSSTALGESVLAFTDFLKEYPHSRHEEQIYTLMSDAFLRSKNYTAALSALDSIQNPSRKMLETRQYLCYQLGTDAFLQGKLEQSRKWMTEVLSSRVDNQQLGTDAYYWRAEASYRLHDYPSAERDVDAFLARPQVRQSANYQAGVYLRAYTYFSQHRYKDAEGSFSHYVRLLDSAQPSYADAINRLGDCAFNARAFERSIGYYNQVIAMSATGSDYATFQKGYAEGLLRQYEKKISTMKQLVTNYPKSDFADDALYEMARAELQMDHNVHAISAYEQLLSTYPNSNMARKASLELAMLYRNQHDYDKAITAYKKTISQYPASEEAYTALDGLEAIYVETNKISEYMAYTKQLGKLNMQVATKDDSLSYAAGELQYMLGNYREAAASLTTYLSQYCSGGRYCTSAQYYVADCFYRLDDKKEALAAFRTLSGIAGNPYMLEACTRVAEICYDKGDYKTAMEYFYKMLNHASTTAETNVARLGILRCSYYLGNHKTTIDIATQILSDEPVADDVRQEALYNRAKAYLADNQYGLAIVDLMPISAEVRTAIGAESKYLLAECYYHLKALDNAEQEVMSFAKMNTQQQYWLAKALILLSDINLSRGDDFQARQYLLSLQANYKQTDDIQQIVAERLQLLDERQSEKIVEEDEE